MKVTLPLLAVLLGSFASGYASTPIDLPAAPSEFIAVDTSHLMGAPESPAPLGVEKAFPQLKFERPVEVVHAGDGSRRLFVVEQGGLIRVFPNEAEAKETQIFLDLSDVVRRKHNEEGLLGLAFHPRYKENGEFFVFYSTTPRGTVVSRFRVSKDDANRADRGSEEKLMTYPKPHGNHNGGGLRFGPDGYLYISIGDGGLAHDPHGNAQNLKTWFGSILRIDINQKAEGLTYAIPKDNPFAQTASGEARPEIWAYGLRNPWRITFDPADGRLWAADVGQDQFEEIDLITAGGNYGWNFREGRHPRDPKAERDAAAEFIDPIFEYPRAEGKSVTGGVVYRGARVPHLKGAYLYADYMSGNIWALRSDGKRATENTKIARTSLLISAFGEDETGEIAWPVSTASSTASKHPNPPTASPSRRRSLRLASSPRSKNICPLPASSPTP